MARRKKETDAVETASAPSAERKRRGPPRSPETEGVDWRSTPELLRGQDHLQARVLPATTAAIAALVDEGHVKGHVIDVLVAVGTRAPRAQILEALTVRQDPTAFRARFYPAKGEAS